MNILSERKVCYQIKAGWVPSVLLVSDYVISLGGSHQAFHQMYPLDLGPRTMNPNKPFFFIDTSLWYCVIAHRKSSNISNKLQLNYSHSTRNLLWWNNPFVHSEDLLL